MAYTDWRKKFLFDPSKKEPFRISRSKIDLFVECPCCFYLDQRLGIKRPPMPGFTLNIAVDELLKKEFDVHREAGTPHPLMTHFKLDAVPFKHEGMDEWRDSLKRGIAHHHKETNLFVRGGVDDVWVDKEGNLIVVDYKATSKKDKPTLEGGWGEQYKRQMEIYQWLFRQNGFSVSSRGYFLYCNGKKDVDSFDKKLHFDIFLLSHDGDDSWIEETLHKVKECLMGELPEQNNDCAHCAYRQKAAQEESGSDSSSIENKKPAKQKTPRRTKSVSDENETGRLF